MRARGGTAATITSLELTDPAAIRPPRRPPPPALRVAPVEDAAVNRELYGTIGADFRWTDRLAWSGEQWARHAAGVQSAVAWAGGEIAGFYELDVRDGAAEIAIFGLLEHARGAGLGGHLLTHALRAGFARAARVWVHTCTDDGPHALANYEARGLRVFDVRPAG